MTANRERLIDDGESQLMIDACDWAIEVEERLRQYKDAVRDRDDAIRAAFAAGCERLRVAYVTGLSRERVQQITQTTRVKT